MIEFIKMEGIGNDYVYVDISKNIINNPSSFAKRISNRHFGIGSDGLILIDKSNKADFKMSIYNADGSIAEMCGNGIRCVGKYVYDFGLTNKKNISIETLSGIKYLELDVQNSKVKSVTVDMGEPKINGNVEVDDILYTSISIGNPHAVTFLNDIKELDIEVIGPRVENDKQFSNKTNVEFIYVKNDNEIDMRVWERGVGETYACGTGACASVVAGAIRGFTKRKVKVNLKGGTLEIDWKDNNHVYLKGPAKTVFKGYIDEK